jgi:hypothetical protein
LLEFVDVLSLLADDGRFPVCPLTGPEHDCRSECLIRIDYRTQYHPAFAWPVVVGVQGAGSIVVLPALRGSEPVSALDAERHGVKITPVGIEVLQVEE